MMESFRKYLVLGLFFFLFWGCCFLFWVVVVFFNNLNGTLSGKTTVPGGNYIPSVKYRVSVVF